MSQVRWVVGGAVLAFTLTGCGESPPEAGPVPFKATNSPEIEAFTKRMSENAKGKVGMKRPFEDEQTRNGCQGRVEERVIARTEAVSSRLQDHLSNRTADRSIVTESHRCSPGVCCRAGWLKKDHGNSRRRACRIRLLEHRCRAGSSLAFQIGEELDQITQLSPF